MSVTPLTKTAARIFKDSLGDAFDTRNIADEYKGLTVPQVRELLLQKQTELVVLCPNIIRDMNWGSVVRNANGFGVKEVVFTGAKKYDRRGAVGAQHYTKILYYSDWRQAIENYKNAGYSIVAVENNISYPTQNIYDFAFPLHTVLVFGEEGRSLEDEILEVCDYCVQVPMRGSVRSFNLSTTCGIVLAFYNQQHYPN